MEALGNKMGIFEEEGGLNVEEKLEGGWRDCVDIDNQPKKEPRNDQPSSSV